MARGLSYELLESDQHSKICSEPLIFSWLVINCKLYMWYAEEVGGRSVNYEPQSESITAKFPLNHNFFPGS